MSEVSEIGIWDSGEGLGLYSSLCTGDIYSHKARSETLKDIMQIRGVKIESQSISVFRRT